MKKNSQPLTKSLRGRAEEILKSRLPITSLPLSEADAVKLIHELQVNQIELELQQEELLKSKEFEVQLENQECFRLTLDHLLEGCMIIGFDWTYLYVNNSIAKGGHTRESLLGHTIFEMYPGVEKSNIFSYYKRCMDERIPLHFEESYTFTDGTTTWNNFSVEPVPEGIFVFALDITGRKTIEEQLRKNEARLKVALSLIKFTLFNQDVDLRYTWIFQSQIGLTDEQIIGKTDEEIMIANPESAQKMTEIKRGVLQSGKSAHVQVEYKYFNKILHYSIFVEPLFSIEGQIVGITGASLDITEQKRTEDEITKSREQLQQLYRHLNDVKEAERATIAREIHDELGQDLASLKIDLIGIQEDFDENLKLKRRIDKAITLVNSSIKTVQKISSSLRPQMLDELGLTSAIEWLSNDFRKRTGIKCKLNLQEIEDLDKNIVISLFRIFQAAITNIMLHAKAKSISVKLELRGDSLLLSVKDDGVGITQEQINSPKSYGIIGMSERTAQINGSFEINSEINKGTEIKVIVPVISKKESI